MTEQTKNGHPSWMTELLREFHGKFGLTTNSTPQVPDIKDVRLRINLINEEAAEFEQASLQGDIVEVADAIADLLYVVIGAAVTWGIPAEECFREVHRSNMTKVWADGSVRRRDSDGKVLKPTTYSPADIKGIVG